MNADVDFLIRLISMYFRHRRPISRGVRLPRIQKSRTNSVARPTTNLSQETPYRPARFPTVAVLGILFSSRGSVSSPMFSNPPPCRVPRFLFLFYSLFFFLSSGGSHTVHYHSLSIAPRCYITLLLLLVPHSDLALGFFITHTHILDSAPADVLHVFPPPTQKYI